LVLILSLFVYRIITHLSYVYAPDEVLLSKYTGERILNSQAEKPAKIATYTNTKEPISGLSTADMVLEFLNSSSTITYKAIYSSEAAENINANVSLKDYGASSIQKFKFSDNIMRTDNKGTSATSIFVTFNEDTSSNFLYCDGEYYHYKGLHIDKDTNSPIKLSNIIVQFIHGTIKDEEYLTASENSGTGLFFCGGVAQNINWNRAKNTAIEINYKEGGEVLLKPGPTWWIFIDIDCSVSYD